MERKHIAIFLSLGKVIPTKRGRPSRKHLFKSVLVILCVSAMILLLEHVGCLRKSEMASLDTWLRLKSPVEVSDVIIVGITEEDYKDQKRFRGQSPLLSIPLQDVIEAIVRGSPRVIGIDLDTSEVQLHFKDPSHKWPVIVWAQDVLMKDGKLEPLPVLTRKDSPYPSGIALLPQDPDGIIRRYRHVFQTEHGPIDSFPWAVVKAFDRSKAREIERSGEDLVLNFSGDRYSFPRMTATNVLDASKGSSWGDQGPLNEKIVLLGGWYRAARDVYITPLGPMAGVELMAQAIESDLHNGGIRRTNKLLMLFFEILGGVVIVILHQYLHLRPGWALGLSLMGIPMMALVFSWWSFSSLSRWASFIPILMAVLIHELYDHAEEYRRACKELEERTASEGLRNKHDK